MGLSLVQRFGTGATIDNSTPSDPILKIKLNALKNSADGGDITNSQGLNTAITPSNADANADKLLTALLVLSIQKQPSSNTDDSLGIYIENPNTSFVKRNIKSEIEVTYQLNFYITDPTYPGLDPDTMVTP